MNSKRTLARDRRHAAVHEAGHLVVATRLGFETCSAWIVANDGGGTDEVTWLGRVQIHNPGKLPKTAQRMVGVAGSVAEWLWQGGWIEDYSPEGLMSESDWHLAGCIPDEPDHALMVAVAEVGRLFERGSQGWQELIAEARRLIVNSRQPG
jgi:hypothetical protein